MGGKITIENIKLTKKPIVKAGMLIRKLFTEVFETFVNPGITTKFWFTKTSDRLEEGQQISWTST